MDIGLGGIGLPGALLLTGAKALFERREARRQMEFQAGMSSTAHQREVADLLAAGLNPILSATKGAGSSTPAGGMAQVGDVVGGAVQASRVRAELELLEAEKNNKLMDTALKDKQRTLTHIEGEKADLEREITGEHLKGARVEGAIDESLYGRVVRGVHRATSAAGAALGGVVGGAAGVLVGRGIRPGAGVGRGRPLSPLPRVEPTFGKAARGSARQRIREQAIRDGRRKYGD